MENNLGGQPGALTCLLNEITLANYTKSSGHLQTFLSCITSGPRNCENINIGKNYLLKNEMEFNLSYQILSHLISAFISIFMHRIPELWGKYRNCVVNSAFSYPWSRNDFGVKAWKSSWIIQPSIPLFNTKMTIIVLFLPLFPCFSLDFCVFEVFFGFKRYISLKNGCEILVKIGGILKQFIHRSTINTSHSLL